MPINEPTTGDYDDMKQKLVTIAKLLQDEPGNARNKILGQIREITNAYLPKPELPTPLPDYEIDWGPVYARAVDGFESATVQGYFDEDLRHYVYECVMTAVFGKGFFEKTRHLKI